MALVVAGRDEAGDGLGKGHVDGLGELREVNGAGSCLRLHAWLLRGCLWGAALGGAPHPSTTRPWLPTPAHDLSTWPRLDRGSSCVEASICPRQAAGVSSSRRRR